MVVVPVASMLVLICVIRSVQLGSLSSCVLFPPCFNDHNLALDCYSTDAGLALGNAMSTTIVFAIEKAATLLHIELLSCSKPIGLQRTREAAMQKTEEIIHFQGYFPCFALPGKCCHLDLTLVPESATLMRNSHSLQHYWNTNP